MVYAEYGDGNFLGFDEEAPFVLATALADEADDASVFLSIVQEAICANIKGRYGTYVTLMVVAGLPLLL